MLVVTQQSLQSLINSALPQAFNIHYNSQNSVININQKLPVLHLEGVAIFASFS